MMKTNESHMISLTSEIIEGRQLDYDEAMSLWTTDHYLLLYCANSIARHFKGDRARLCSIINAKSGYCSEDCTFCAQSASSKAKISSHELVDSNLISKASHEAFGNDATCFGIVTSGHSLSEDDISSLCNSISSLDNPGITIACSTGIMDEKTLSRFKKCGLRKYHHNLETAESFFPLTCTTHSYQDRIQSIKAAKSAGLQVCSGGIFGIGETRDHRVELALTLRDLDVDSVPLNFLIPIPGTPMEDTPPISPTEILKIIAVYRFLLPGKDIIICGGREKNLRDIQSWVFFAGANGIMTGGYLTAQGRMPYIDRDMIRDLDLNLFTNEQKSRL